MAIRVRWFPTLVRRTHSKQAETVVEWRAGMTPLDIFLGEGFSRVDAEAVLAIVNGAQARHDVPLSEGDAVEFMVSIQGGCR